MRMTMNLAVMRAPAIRVIQSSRRGVSVEPGSITAEFCDRRPGWHGRRRWIVIEMGEVSTAIDYSPAYHGQFRRYERNVVLCAREIIPGWHHKIGKLADGYLALLAKLVREPCDILGPHSESSFPI